MDGVGWELESLRPLCRERDAGRALIYSLERGSCTLRLAQSRAPLLSTSSPSSTSETSGDTGCSDSALDKACGSSYAVEG